MFTNLKLLRTGGSAPKSVDLRIAKCIADTSYLRTLIDTVIQAYNHEFSMSPMFFYTQFSRISNHTGNLMSEYWLMSKLDTYKLDSSWLKFNELVQFSYHTLRDEHSRPMAAEYDDEGNISTPPLLEFVFSEIPLSDQLVNWKTSTLLVTFTSMLREQDNDSAALTNSEETIEQMDKLEGVGNNPSSLLTNVNNHFNSTLNNIAITIRPSTS